MINHKKLPILCKDLMFCKYEMYMCDSDVNMTFLKSIESCFQFNVIKNSFNKS